MRILYIDIDTLRPDHLGCYGYHRNTSPNIDKLAAEGVRFENCYVSDSPCLPSRSALYSGQCGIRNGAINHGGAAADWNIDPQERGFQYDQESYIRQLRENGYYTVTVSPFGERHSSFWFYSGFREIYNTGKCGSESAEEVIPTAIDWLDRQGSGDDWYLHVNIWDPHTPYRAPEDLGNPFENEPPPAWMTEEIRQELWGKFGPGTAQETGGDYLQRAKEYERFPRIPKNIDSMENYKKWIDGYDCGIYYADIQVGKLMDKLEELGILDDTLIMISSDHGETQGEMNVFGDHQTADNIINRVPMIIRHPEGLGGKGRVNEGLVYQFDCAATMIEMTGGKTPESWDGISFVEDFKAEKDAGRDYLVVSNNAWSCQRAVRWDDYIMIRNYHSGFKDYPEIMLFNVKEDPHEQKNLVDSKPELVGAAMTMLDEWHTDEMRRSHRDVDPMWTVMREGGPFHARYTSEQYPEYLKRLEETGRGQHVETLKAMESKLKYNK